MVAFASCFSAPLKIPRGRSSNSGCHAVDLLCFKNAVSTPNCNAPHLRRHARGLLSGRLSILRRPCGGGGKIPAMTGGISAIRPHPSVFASANGGKNRPNLLSGGNLCYAIVDSSPVVAGFCARDRRFSDVGGER